MIAAIKWAALTVCVSLTFTGCSRWEPVYEVAPDAVDDVRSIGEVVAHATNEWDLDRASQVNHVLLMDVGAASYEDARKTVLDRLRQRGWRGSGPGLASEVLESPHWEHVLLSVDPLEKLQDDGSDRLPAIVEALESRSEMLNRLAVVYMTP
ncbi:hypothetical protein AB0L65_56720 [Nonomuraea sp. NPDC052116]|uniref:hypothetical protein n=1 Tax=Nonomuraea sp. NPDC052116 TaxID=3155665 RepID=UPI0034379EF6